MAAIEPISSAMSYQAQPVQSVQVAKTAQVQVERPTAEFTDGTAKEAAAAVGNKTIVVDSAGKTESGEDSGYSSQQQNNEATNEQIRKAVEDVNKKMTNSEVLFGIHEGTNRLTIKVVDKTTKETIKEFPPEKTLDMIAKLWEVAGLMVDERR